MAHLGSRATSTMEKGGRESSRWEGRSRDADVGIDLPGGGREGGWEIDAGAGHVLRVLCWPWAPFGVCVHLYFPLSFLFFLLKNFLFLSFFNKRRKLKNKIKNMQVHI